MYIVKLINIDFSNLKIIHNRNSLHPRQYAACDLIHNV